MQLVQCRSCLGKNRCSSLAQAGRDYKIVDWSFAHMQYSGPEMTSAPQKAVMCADAIQALLFFCLVWLPLCFPGLSPMHCQVAQACFLVSFLKLVVNSAVAFHNGLLGSTSRCLFARRADRVSWSMPSQIARIVHRASFTSSEAGRCDMSVC